ncbi:hypothetical protein K2173_025726 [Erythroxylum novogranatense]|uniref:Late embryogenesis abundant protein n=1 Tax=Erythroxylum novogranatense TaxID=1862640 RepID=A0AAV8SBC4_9ROSI|nr:hypothetical protein K2173_025726 [Erythroxylum novogranatense]
MAESVLYLLRSLGAPGFSFPLSQGNFRCSAIISRQLIILYNEKQGYMIICNIWQACLRKDLTSMAFEPPKQAANEAKKVGEELKNKAASAADDATQKTKDAAGNVSRAAQDLSEKAKQTVQDAWGTVKDTTERIKDTVTGKAEESKEFIKENAEAAKRSMNTKN